MVVIPTTDTRRKSLTCYITHRGEDGQQLTEGKKVDLPPNYYFESAGFLFLDLVYDNGRERESLGRYNERMVDQLDVSEELWNKVLDNMIGRQKSKVVGYHAV
jgi:hypothetical protein